ncbi:pyruvate, phosphate dikinase [Candidatus Woesearchaeota archaeon]|nr:pyruvate, phosphate dikinase [Candidatus Woesearchaeota archaeon]
MKKYVYSFEEGSEKLKSLLGGKGAGLAEMTGLGIRVPPGFTLTTEACAEFYRSGKKWPAGLKEEVDKKLEELEKKMKAKLGDNENPLLVSVRSGAVVSMPGMMDTVLNLGLNDKSVLGLAKKTKNERFAYDAYRRFINMFGDVVMGVDHKYFEEVLSKAKKTKNVKFDTDLDAEDLKKICEQYKGVIKKNTGKLFPDDPKKQLQMSIDAVFDSWNNKRAIAYRRINNITGLLGTAVNVQTMVFGNMGDNSGTGVFFSRNPSTGENEFYGEYLMNAQGEDVVAGIRTPQPITQLKKVMPKIYDELIDIYKKVEKHYKDMQDMEFTIQEGRLYLLQTRNGKRTAYAAVKIATDMVKEGLISKEEAVLKVDPEQLDQLLHKQLDQVAKQKAEVIAKGLPASPGAAVGKIVFTAERAVELAGKGEKVILVRTETSPEDIQGMNAAEGILTSRGGLTSHAAVVARGMGKCCVAGCSDIIVHEDENKFIAKELTFKEGDSITLDGTEGEVIKGEVPTVDPQLKGEFKTLMGWADSFRKIKVKTNADTPHDSKVARDFGAEGIGLCRTEHMFFEGDRIIAVREMILAENAEERKRALDKIKPMQKEDFKGIFKVMSGLPVIIRLLDPPLHEFLPKEGKEIKEMAREMKVSEQKIKDTISSLHEFNPMLGFRGCRLGIKYPEINEMQARAILEAAVECRKEGIKAIPQIEVPLVGNVKEFVIAKDIIEKVGAELKLNRGKDYWIGTMIEVPRAAITADEIAPEADFMSFGTNDLTQMGCGFSRDDAGKFLKPYVEEGIYARDPFQSIDQEGVGKLMQICIEKARKAKPHIEIGICGEHGGDPESVKFCHRIGLNDVSCSPYRVPIARLAAAQADLEEKKKGKANQFFQH